MGATYAPALSKGELFMNVRTVKVLNYLPSTIAVTSRTKNVALQPCEDGIPTFEYFAATDVQYINSTSPVFKTGALEFEEGEREEIYEMLAMPDWREKCLFERDIDSLVLNPTMENLQRIVDIPDNMTLERVRGHMEYLIATGADVSVNMSKVVNARFKELARGERVSKIKLASVVENKEKTVASLQAQLAQMAELQNQLMEKLAKLSGAQEANLAKENEEPVKDAAAASESSVNQEVAPKTAAKATGRKAAAKK